MPPQLGGNVSRTTKHYSKSPGLGFKALGCGAFKASLHSVHAFLKVPVAELLCKTEPG